MQLKALENISKLDPKAQEKVLNMIGNGQLSLKSV